MKRIILSILLCVITFSLYACSCGGEEKVEYSKEEGVAEGTVDLSGDKPKISISNIKAKVGTDIDYLSGVVIEDEEKYEDLKVWVDASNVDIDEPGDYKAKYTFEYDGKKIEHEITVTIIADTEQSAADVANNAQEGGAEGGDNANAGIDNGYVGDSNVGNSNVGNDVDNGDVNNNQDVNIGDNGAQNQVPIVNDGGNGENVVANTTNNVVQNTPATQSTTKNQGGSANTQATQATTKTPSAGGSTTQTTGKRQMITSAASGTTAAQNIGYSYIELLSGSTISIKSTTAKYIVSTRTDVSYKTKNDVKYKVSKLIITYNTGDERTLETVEEKCN